jgi:hypothetical protein
VEVVARFRGAAFGLVAERAFGREAGEAIEDKS